MLVSLVEDGHVTAQLHLTDEINQINEVCLGTSDVMKRRYWTRTQQRGGDRIEWDAYV
jgi:hypothetical protein